MEQIHRNITEPLKTTLERGQSILLLGSRQTGKTTVVKTLSHDRYITLMDPSLRQRYELNPGALIEEIRSLKISLNKNPIVIIDEIQKVPDLTDSIQVLIDEGTGVFLLTGSSVRKIRNLLPGRVLKFQMDPLILAELKDYNIPIEQLLNNGSLPGIRTMEQAFQEDALDSYVTIYLEEEIRKEALVRNLGHFSHFLRLACIDSGNIVNFTGLAQEIGISPSTIKDYYSILLDCMLIEKIEALTKTTSRKKLSKSPKFILFDLGVRRLGAKESDKPTEKQQAMLFEQFIGLELIKAIRAAKKKMQVMYWRDHGGPEVDFVLEQEGRYIPIEVKWTKTPSSKDTKHLLTFLKEYPAQKGYIVCRTPYPMQLSENIKAISWKDLEEIIFSE